MSTAGKAPATAPAAAGYVPSSLAPRPPFLLFAAIAEVTLPCQHANNPPSTTRKEAATPTPTNPRGIPQAPFVDKVEDYVTTRDDVEPTLRRFQEMIA